MSEVFTVERFRVGELTWDGGFGILPSDVLVLVGFDGGRMRRDR